MQNLQGGTLALEHRYDVQQRTGQIGFVTQYHGQQDPFDRPIWLTVYDVIAEAGAPPAVFERLRERAELASHLDAPGVLRTLDYGEIEAGLPFVVSERVSGYTLASFLAREDTLSPEQTLEIVDRLAAVLTAAHEQGVAHGALSPNWIHIRDEDLSRAMIGHFQLGLSIDEMLAAEGAVINREAASAVPPEAFEERDGSTDELPPPHFTVAADVYALGAIAYTALVGVHPYFDDEEDASEGLLRLRTGRADPLEELGIDPELSRVVQRAIARDPDGRWSDAAAFAEAFREVVAPERIKHRDLDTGPAPDKDVATPDHSAKSRPEAPAGPSEPLEREPGPSDLLLTIIVAALLFSNLGWIYYISYTDGQQSGASQATSVLPREGGLKIESDPTGATVRVIDGEAPSRLGETPFVISEGLLGDSAVELEVKKDGFDPTRIRIDRSQDGHEILVPLDANE
ncbi:MAG: serine/threonine protein kinase [Myxococcota bacterium]